MKILIIEDETPSQEYLINILNGFAFKNIETANSLDSAILKLNQSQPALVFSDIRLGNNLVFDAFEKVKNPNFGIIFTTAYEEYALKAIKLSAFDYLLKPINPLEVHEALQKFVNSSNQFHKEKINILIDSSKGSLDYLDFFFVNTKYEVLKLFYSDIQYLMADGNYTIIHTNTKKIVSSKTLKYFEDILDPSVFIRYSRYGILHKNSIKSFDDNTRTIESKDGRVHQVSVRKSAEFDIFVKNQIDSLH